MDAQNDAEIARILAEEQAYIGGEYPGFDDSDDNSDYKPGHRSSKKKKQAKGGRAAKATTTTDKQDNPDEDFQEAPAKKEKGSPRQQRRWSQEEQDLFLQGIALHGRNWKQVADHIGTRDYRAVMSHCQKYLIKVFLQGGHLTDKMGESGQGFTLSGKPLDPNSATAKAYGITLEKFKKALEIGNYELGIHLTTFDFSTETSAKPERASKQKQPSKKRLKTSSDVDDPANEPRSNKTLAQTTNDETTLASEHACQSPDEAAAQKYFLADAHADYNALPPAAEPTEYAKNRPRRHLPSARVQMGDTTESLDLTNPLQFIGPIGGGSPLAQPFSVKISPQALLVMDFHAHLSTCEIIGLLGGTFDHASKEMRIDAAFPCRRTAGSDSGTSVELDAESQVEVTLEMSQLGLIPVGWYHSHPIFAPRPSVKDNENQRNYQVLCRDGATGLEPWLGAIVGPYDRVNPTAASLMQLWVVRQSGKNLEPYNVVATLMMEEKKVPCDSVVEHQLVMALEHIKDDMGKVDINSVWRSFARINIGSVEGPPMTHAEKIKEALKVHLPKDEEKKGDVDAFFSRIGGYFKQIWNVEVPALIMPCETSVPVNSPPLKDETKPDGGVDTAAVHAIKNEEYNTAAATMATTQVDDGENKLAIAKSDTIIAIEDTQNNSNNNNNNDDDHNNEYKKEEENYSNAQKSPHKINNNGIKKDDDASHDDSLLRREQINPNEHDVVVDLKGSQQQKKTSV